MSTDGFLTRVSDLRLPTKSCIISCFFVINMRIFATVGIKLVYYISKPRSFLLLFHSFPPLLVHSLPYFTRCALAVRRRLQMREPPEDTLPAPYYFGQRSDEPTGTEVLQIAALSFILVIRRVAGWLPVDGSSRF